MTPLQNSFSSSTTFQQLENVLKHSRSTIGGWGTRVIILMDNSKETYQEFSALIQKVQEIYNSNPHFDLLERTAALKIHKKIFSQFLSQYKSDLKSCSAFLRAWVAIRDFFTRFNKKTNESNQHWNTIFNNYTAEQLRQEHPKFDLTTLPKSFATSQNKSLQLYDRNLTITPPKFHITKLLIAKELFIHHIFPFLQYTDRIPFRALNREWRNSMELCTANHTSRLGNALPPPCTIPHLKHGDQECKVKSLRDSNARIIINIRLGNYQLRKFQLSNEQRILYVNIIGNQLLIIKRNSAALVDLISKKVIRKIDFQINSESQRAITTRSDKIFVHAENTTSTYDLKTLSLQHKIEGYFAFFNNFGMRTTQNSRRIQLVSEEINKEKNSFSILCNIELPIEDISKNLLAPITLPCDLGLLYYSARRIILYHKNSGEQTFEQTFKKEENLNYLRILKCEDRLDKLFVCQVKSSGNDLLQLRDLTTGEIVQAYPNFWFGPYVKPIETRTDLEILSQPQSVNTGLFQYTQRHMVTLTGRSSSEIATIDLDNGKIINRFAVNEPIQHLQFALYGHTLVVKNYLVETNQTTLVFHNIISNKIMNQFTSPGRVQLQAEGDLLKFTSFRMTYFFRITTGEFLTVYNHQFDPTISSSNGRFIFKDQLEKGELTVYDFATPY